MEDWPVTLLPGIIAATVAALAWLGDLRRSRRKHLDAVGFMPWTSVFFWAVLAACVLLGLAARDWAAG